MGAILALATPAEGQSVTTGSVTIESAASSTGANVVLDVLSQTNVVLTVSGPAQAVTSVSLPRSLNVGGGGSADVRLPTVVSPLAGAGAMAAPNVIATSVGANGPQPGSAGQNDVMLIVIQYN
ncbi:MAG: hypothetical protein JF628_05015 [Sphingomonas sp.]|nr:hypothetical protein [Sphingomonas sp.]